MLTLDEVAATLRISPEGVRLEIKAGRLKALKAGPGLTSPWRIAESDLAEYIASGIAKHAAAEAS
jgi:excisionase family DNA binding protein